MHLDRYEVGPIIAQSAHTIVRRARRLEDGKLVVIKAPLGEYPTLRALSQLEFEYRILGKLTSERVIRAYSLERDSGRLAMILEDFGGEPVPTHPGRGLSLDLFFLVAAEVARALGHVHAQNVIHKDINPQNILLNPTTRQIKLIDFGLASELTREHLELRPTTQLEGTVPYVSPEQTGRMNRDLDYRTDYYSLGVTFFELLTGSLPFTAADAVGYVHSHLSKPAPDPRERNAQIPAALAHIVGKLMAKNPDDRYQSARGLLADLDEARKLFEQGQTTFDFALGTRDASERFQVSQKLVGRDAEVSMLMSVFDAASKGPATLFLVAGYSGIGKSSLVREIHKPVVGKRGTFVAGKFDQVERNSPYGAVTQALRELVRQLLAEPEEVLAAWKQRLLSALGTNGNVLVALIPELEQVIGPQPPVPELPAREAQTRIFRVFRDFFGAVATPAHPLVVFIDDLQWTDASTPPLLVHLLADGELKHVLFVGAYRDNEVSAGHLWRIARSELEEKRRGAVREIKLAPLSEAGLNQLVADTLRCGEEESRPLSALLAERTAGNPFFLNELLSLLHREGALTFAPHRGRFVWDDDKVARAAVSNNVADLLVHRLQGLPADTMQYLRLASCIGNEFDIGMLSRIAGKGPGAVGTALWLAVEERLIFPRGDGYRLLRADGEYDTNQLASLSVKYQFPHDRVLSAVYTLLGEDERAAVHLSIGRLLLKAAKNSEREQKVFEFVDHLNLGRKLVTSLEERDELAQLNYAAGQRARRSAAYGVAVVYLETAISLLSKEEWEARRARHFECCRMRVECISLSGRVDRASDLCDELFGVAYDKLTGASVYCLKAAILETQSRLAESCDVICKGLASLGQPMPQDHAEIDREIGAGLGKMQAHLARTPIERLVDLPVMTDELMTATMSLLFQLIPPASQMHPPLFILAELILFDLELTHGTVPASCKNIVDCGILLGTILNDYAGGYRMAKVAFQHLERNAPTPLESSVNFVFGCFIAHWGSHFQEGLDALARGYQRGVALGDVLHAAYSIAHRAKNLFFAGRDLGECEAETERALAYTVETGAVGQMHIARVVERAVARVRGSTRNPAAAEPPDEAFIDTVRQTGNVHTLYVLGQSQAMACLLLGDLDGVARWDALATEFFMISNGTLPVPDYFLIKSLLLAKKWPSAAADEREKILTTLAEHQAKLKSFADVSPANFTHKYKLVSAEIARLRGEPMEEVLRLYRDTVAAAGDDFLHLRALTYELEAEFWTEKGNPELAKACVFEAYYLYRRWGAPAKLERMERLYPAWLGRTPERLGGSTPLRSLTRDTVEAFSLDIASVLKANHAISSEVRSERVFAVLMDTIIENAGAQHGYLILKGEDGELTVEAKASITDGEPLARSLPLRQCDGVAQDIVRYVVRTHGKVVLDDARADEAYGSDRHVREGGVKSVLCIPILNQRELLAILYAENNAVERAFTPQRMGLVEVIAGQAAISIANAKLYNNLERKVAERTRELTDRNREIAALLNCMELGVFMIDEALTVQPEYSAHLEHLLGTRDIAGKNCVELLLGSGGAAEETGKTLRSALQFSFGVPYALAEANTSHLIRELYRPAAAGQPASSLEIEWSLIVDADDIVREILVTLRDVTTLKHLRSVAAQNARELDIVGQILDAGVQHFHRFCASARSFMRENESLLGGDGAIDRSAAERLFRNMHTVKGNARMLGLGHLANCVHVAEESFQDLLRAPAPVRDKRGPVAAMGTVLDALREYEGICERKLGDVMRGADASEDGRWDEIEAAVLAVRSQSLGPSDAIARVEQSLERARAVPLGRIVKKSARMLPGLAQELGKVAPVVEADDGGLWLSARWAKVMSDALVHAFQNAIDHGIESADERERQGKPRQGNIQVLGSRTKDGITVLFRDDGQGLPVDALREQANAAETDEQAAARAFGTGVSTADRVTTISGRGVGLSAVRSSVSERGGNVVIAFTGEAKSGRRPFELVFQLPADAAIADAPKSA